VTDLKTQDIKKTPLEFLHLELGAKMVPFAGYSMPVQYPDGIIAEHLHTRQKASVFDVSHMGQAKLTGEGAVAALETLVPGDILNLEQGRTRYTVLVNDQAGIIDDLMVTNRGDHLYLVVNADGKERDFAHIERHLDGKAELEILCDRALVALQGPAAADVLMRFSETVKTMPFMSVENMQINGIPCLATRSGYTGEDGFEISCEANDSEKLLRALLAEPEVAPAGLGARDSLRLEAGLCLYGSDIDETTTPIEAGLAWIIGKRRREDGGFPGAEIIQAQLKSGTANKRVGIKPEGKAPARAHTVIEDLDGNTIGEITSGGYGPSVGGPVAMGYVKTDFSKPETGVNLIIRGKARPGRVVKLPFIEHRYFKI